MTLRPQVTRSGHPGVAWLLAALPLVLLWPVMRQTVEAGMLLHMLLEFPVLFASGWAAHHLSLGRAGTRRMARLLVLLDWRGWSGATLASGVIAAWMLPSLLDMALLLPAVAAVKYASWWASGWVLGGSLRRMDPEVLLFFVGNLVWMMCSAGLLLIDAPERLCVNYLHDDQVRTGEGLVLLASVLGAWALWQAVSPSGPRAAADTPERLERG